jgi:hypothetical protein
MSLDHHNKTIAKADVDNALRALGIPEEQWKNLMSVQMDAREVTLTLAVPNDKGQFTIAHTDLGKGISTTEVGFKIIRDTDGYGNNIEVPDTHTQRDCKLCGPGLGHNKE